MHTMKGQVGYLATSVLRESGNRAVIGGAKCINMHDSVATLSYSYNARIAATSC